MAEFTMTVAGAAARIRSLFESTPAFFGKYLSDEPPVFYVAVTEEDLRHQARLLYEEALAEGFRVKKFPEPFLERAVIQRKFSEFLFDRNTLLLHGSTVAVDGKAYLFTARCGTGKSTHTRLWRQVLGTRAVMVNDDKPFLRITPQGVTAYGSPWSGKHGLDNNISAPLAGICILERGAENAISPMSAEEALPLLRHQAFCPEDKEKEAAFLAMTEALANTVPLWHLFCRPDEEAARLAFAAMGK